MHVSKMFQVLYCFRCFVNNSYVKIEFLKLYPKISCQHLHYNDKTLINNNHHHSKGAIDPSDFISNQIY